MIDNKRIKELEEENKKLKYLLREKDKELNKLRRQINNEELMITKDYIREYKGIREEDFYL